MPTWSAPLDVRFNKEKPRKLLAIDGGGIRGVLALEILAEMERQLRSETNLPKLKLGDYFDYIGGTSTGAIIAAGLAIGMTTDQLLEFYRRFGRQMFEETALLNRIATLGSSLYKDEPLAGQLQKIFSDGGEPMDLSTERLRCLLLVVTRNATTDSPWPISNNPFAKYNDPGRPDCNLRIPLWQLVRASTAAPVFFPPEVVRLNPKKPKEIRVFVDGGITPYNNPAFLLYRMATHPSYRLNWKTGEKDLLLISVGTGAAASATNSIGRNLAANLQGLPGELMYGIQVEQDINCRTFGRCVHGSEIDRELGDLVLAEEDEQAGTKDHGRFFRYARYNADLGQEALDALKIGSIPSEKVQKMDAVDQMENLSKIGQAVGKRDVNVRKHFGSFIAG